MTRRLVLVLAGAAALVAAAGCAKDQSLRKLNFHPAAQANEGRPFYLLVRTATEKDFFTDDYHKVVGMVFPPSEDPSVLASQLVWPGRQSRVEVKVADKKSFAVYVLYTSPREPWKVLIAPPLKPEYHFLLSGGRITSGQPPNKKGGGSR